MTLRISACLIAAMALPAIPVAAQESGMQVAPVAEIVEGVQSCRDATSSTGVDPEVLAADGWSALSVTQDGRSSQTPVPMLSKGSLLLMYADPQTPACFVIARIDEPDTALRVAAGLDGHLATARKQEGEKPIPAYWFPAGHVVQLQTTGSIDKPAVRISVGGRPASATP